MKNLQKLRKEKKLTQKELAQIFNISQNTLSQWEANIIQTNHNQLIMVADYFGVTIDYLLGREPDSGLIYVHRDPALSENEKEIITTYRKIPPTKHPQAVALLNVLIDKDIKKETHNIS